MATCCLLQQQFVNMERSSRPNLLSAAVALALLLAAAAPGAEARGKGVIKSHLVQPGDQVVITDTTRSIVSLIDPRSGDFVYEVTPPFLLDETPDLTTKELGYAHMVDMATCPTCDFMAVAGGHEVALLSGTTGKMGPVALVPLDKSPAEAELPAGRLGLANVFKGPTAGRRRVALHPDPYVGEGLTICLRKMLDPEHMCPLSHSLCAENA